MLSLSLLLENKIASGGGLAIVLGFVLVLSASTVKISEETEKADHKKKRTLMALGGSVMSLGVLLQVYDQYTRRYGVPGSSSQLSSSSMSSADLASFQQRVATAASNLRRSMESSSSSYQSSPSSSHASGESAADLAARASAQISSFMNNYS